jgi:hypothetical protein
MHAFNLSRRLLLGTAMAALAGPALAEGAQPSDAVWASAF